MRAETFARVTSALKICLYVLVILGLLSSAALANKAITKVDVTKKPDCVVITVEANTALIMKTIKSSRGSFVAFQFPFRLEPKGRLVGVHSGRIYNVRYSNYSSNPASTRIVVNTCQHVDYSTEWSSDNRRVEITIWKQPGRNNSLQAAAPPTPAIKTAAAVSPVVKVLGSLEMQPPSDTLSSISPVPQLPAITALPAAKIQPANFVSKIKQVSSELKMTAPSVVPIEPNVMAPRINANRVLVASAAPIVADTPVAADEPEPVPVIEAAVESKSEPAKASKPTQKAASVKPVQTEASLKPKSAVVAKAEPFSSFRSEKTVNLNFLGADINDVLKALSVQSGYNVVSSKDVTGNITISLNGVTVTEALDYIAKLSGYSYAKMNNTYLVGPKQSVRALTDEGTDDTKVEVVALRYAGVEEATTFLKNEFPDIKISSGNAAGKNDKDAGTKNGLLVISGSSNTVAQAKELISQVDQSMKDLVGENVTKVYHIKYVDAKALASSLTGLVPGLIVTPAPTDGFQLRAPNQVALSNDSGSSIKENSTKPQEKLPQALVLIGREADVQKGLELAASLDIKTPQIKIDAKITSLTKSGEKKLGLTWEWGNFAKLENFTDFEKSTNDTPLGRENIHNVKIANGKMVRQPWSFAATLEAIIQNGEGSLLASPSMLLLENQPGVFFIGDEVKYIVLVQQTDNGANITTETANVGVQLRVAADVNPDGYITMNLHPEVSTIKLTTQKDLQITLPIISRRFTDHTIRVKNGETIVIGGLIRDEELETLTKVPILGDLPFFGNFFRHREKTKNHSEIVIFITATILDD